jgi:acetyl esterase
MTLDPRLQAIFSGLPPREAPTGTPAERRAAARSMAEFLPVLRTPSGPAFQEQELEVPTGGGSVPVRVYRPRKGLLPAVIYIHGGGWWQGELDESDELCRSRAAANDCVVISIGYRLAPEHPFPVPLEDCWAATRWVFAEAERIGIDPARVAVSGSSAGGNLAAAVTLLARDEPGIGLAAQLLEIPAVDLTLQTCRGSAEEFAEGYGLSKADVEECVSFYLADHDPTDPLASPFHADLEGLPPALVMTCECDPVRDDGEAYAAKLEKAGVPVILRRWEGMVHGSAEMDRIVPDIAAEYSAEVRAFLQKYL